MKHSSVLTRYHTDAQKNTFDGAKMKTRVVSSLCTGAN